ncbi:MAG: TPR repeat-containing protein YrrB [Candidatus Heimdallarchaeota archaeon LC_3]|nr:MAG: TPR repeat-containing protein YrrB [Candidatus Heimdallarchaeota archaeon LC_3]
MMGVKKSQEVPYYTFSILGISYFLVYTFFYYPITNARDYLNSLEGQFDLNYSFWNSFSTLHFNSPNFSELTQFHLIDNFLGFFIGGIYSGYFLVAIVILVVATLIHLIGTLNYFKLFYTTSPFLEKHQKLFKAKYKQSYKVFFVIFTLNSTISIAKYYFAVSNTTLVDYFFPNIIVLIFYDILSLFFIHLLIFLLWIISWYVIYYFLKLDAHDYIEKGRRYYEKSDFTKAIENYRLSSEVDGTNAKTFNYWGVSLLSLDNFAEASAKFKKAIELFPENSLFHENLSYTLSLLRKYEEAGVVYDEVKRLNPDKNKINYHSYLGSILIRQGKLEEAVESFQKSHDADPKDIKIYVPWIDSLTILGRNEEAIKLIEEVMNEHQNIDYKIEASLLNYWGVSHLNLNRYVDAIEKFQKAVQIIPEFFVAYENWGISLSFLKRFQESKEKFEKAIEILNKIRNDEEIFHLYLNWINNLILLKQNDAVLENVEKALKINAKSPRIFNYWGVALLKLNRLEEAVRKFEKAVKIDRNLIVAYSNLIYTHCLLGNFKEADIISQYPWRLKVDEIKILFSYGTVLAELGRHEKAIEKFEQVWERDSRLNHNYLAWTDCLISLNRFEEVLEKVEEWLEINPDSDKAYNYWGVALLNLDRVEEGMKKFHKATKLNPNITLPLENWGYALGILGKYEEAIEKYQKIIEMDPLNAIAYYFWGLGLQRSNKFMEAIEKFKKATEFDPYLTDAYCDWALTLGTLGDLEAASNMYQKVIELEPNNAIIYNYWGVILLQMQLFEDAIEKFKKAIDLEPKFTLPYENWGYILRLVGNFEESKEKYLKALELNPYNANTYRSYGISLAHQGNHEEAIDQFVQSSILDSKGWEAYYYWGLTLSQMQNFEEAIKKFKISSELNPEFALIYYSLSVSLDKLGEEEEAKKKYQKAIELDPSLGYLNTPSIPWYIYQ